jgi:hypothetical protein
LTLVCWQDSMQENSYPNLGSWVFAMFAAALIGAVTIYLCLFHFGLGIPIPRLVLPYIWQFAATLLISPILYHARKRQALTNGTDVRLYFWAISLYSACVLFSWVFFGIQLGLIPKQDGTVWYAIAAIAPCGGSVAGYFFRKGSAVGYS